MAELISRETVAVEVDYYGLAVEDWDDTHVPVPFPKDWEQGPFQTAHPGRLSFTSAGHTHTATMTIEVWAEEPAEPAGDWEESAVTEISCTSGQLQAQGLTAGPWPEPVRISDKPGTWNVRAQCRGRAEVAVQSQDEAVDGVEQYVLQLWPQA
ncbi:hypothetical protein [Streptomyces sp. CC224B]|uniref:hypothetical protein n=1 Tax=Streptomyces sp. CC224B TaxID=3044571 RepID=UPI0024A90063|nr:hypothetical protein [Streptomyces sp. CC224B]